MRKEEKFSYKDQFYFYKHQLEIGTLTVDDREKAYALWEEGGNKHTRACWQFAVLDYLKLSIEQMFARLKEHEQGNQSTEKDRLAFAIGIINYPNQESVQSSIEQVFGHQDADKKKDNTKNEAQPFRVWFWSHYKPSIMTAAEREARRPDAIELLDPLWKTKFKRGFFAKGAIGSKETNDEV